MFSEILTLECKVKDPEHTSLCVVLPLWAKAKWNKYMQIIKEYPAGTQVFTVPDGLPARKALPGVPWPVRVYYDTPAKPGAVSQPTLASIGPTAMRLAVQIASWCKMHSSTWQSGLTLLCTQRLCQEEWHNSSRKHHPGTTRQFSGLYYCWYPPPPTFPTTSHHTLLTRTCWSWLWP